MNNKPFYIAGIGASAGGQEALRKFFAALQPQPGLAFVIIQHLSREHKSLTKEWLGRITLLPILSVEADTLIEPDHIYLMPENRVMKMAGNCLTVEERDPQEVANFAIDGFFHSLAEAWEEKAIGIILSGTGTDGARGVLSIKARGGMVLVQQPDTAEFDGMPVSSIANDHPDLILPPDQLAQQIVAYVRNPASLSEESLEQPDPSEQEMIQDIIGQVSQYSRVDFRTYKLNTILRRIEKRTKLNHLHSLADYHAYLKSHPAEMALLYQNLLIGVTYFFRDPLAFRALEEKGLPLLFQQRKSYETVRIWVTACSTGEEAYSVAILCEEYLQAHQLEVPYKIFATDLDPTAIEIASVGRYRSDIEADISPDRLEKYFTRQDDFYDIKKSLRKKIIFARHNLISDPPFLKLHLLTCRNVFIYLKADLQKKLLDNFSYALHPDGLLLLGANETSNGVDSHFEALAPQWKLYLNRREGHQRPRVFEVGSVDTLPTPSRPRTKRESRPVPLPTESSPYEDIIYEEFVPACLLINPANELVYRYGSVDRFLRFPQKRMSWQIFDLVEAPLATALKNGLRKVRNGESRILLGAVTLGEQGGPIDLHFKEVRQSAREQPLVLVEFRENTTLEKVLASSFSPQEASRQVVEELEMELKLTRQELQFSVDELESLNEELQSANEEMHSSNEELQSTNEEMHSSNEELHTVNHELQFKIDEVLALHNDMTNLVNNTEIAMVFLDQELRIRKFTPAARANFHFLATDLGRPLAHLTHNFVYDSLLADTQQVLQSNQSLEREVEDRQGCIYLTRMLPYRDENGRVQGVVVTFVNVTPLKQAALALEKRTRELEESEQSWKTLANNLPDIIARYDEHFTFLSVNRAVETHFGRESEHILGRTHHEIGLPVPPEKAGEWRDLLASVFQTAQPRHTYFEYEHEGEPRYYYASLVPEYAADGKTVESVLSISRDITELKKHEAQIEQQNQALKKSNADLDDFVYTASHDLRAPITNLEALTARLTKRLDGKADPTERTLLEMTAGAVHKLKKTITDLTEVVKVQQPTDEPVESVDLATLLEEVKADLDGLTAEAVITADWMVPELAYTRNHLRSILYNLLSNGLKYRSPQRPPYLRLSTEPWGAGVRLTCSDNGLGMEAYQLQKLFTMFRRFHPDVEGTGLGLYTIKRLIENHGGSIHVESQPDQGTTFRIDLNLTTSDA